MGQREDVRGCLKGIYLSTEYPKNRGVIARHVGKELRATTMATFYKVCPPHLYDRRKAAAATTRRLRQIRDSQSEILFLHLDDPETAGIIRGLEINWFLIDQAEENPEHMEELFDLLSGASAGGTSRRCRRRSTLHARDREAVAVRASRERHGRCRRRTRCSRATPTSRRTGSIAASTPRAGAPPIYKRAGLQDVPHAERRQPVPRRDEPPLPAGARRGVHPPQRQGPVGQPEGTIHVDRPARGLSRARPSCSSTSGSTARCSARWTTATRRRRACCGGPSTATATASATASTTCRTR
jgi:hypothetical protein